MHPKAVSGTILDDIEFNLRELCQTCGVTAEHILDMVEEGVLEPLGTSPRDWRFGGGAVIRVKIALRLQRDLRVNLPGVALVLDLLEEIEVLRHSRRRS